MDERLELKLARFSHDYVSSAVSDLDQAIIYMRESIASTDMNNKESLSRFYNRLDELEAARKLLVYGDK